MSEPISITLLTKVTEAVFSYALSESGLADKVRAWLGWEPARLAFQTAFLRALQRFAATHPRWAASLVDQAFLTREDVAAELAKFLTRRDAPDPNALARAWAEQLPHVGERHREDAARALADFLHDLESELGNQEALRAIHDSRALERIVANTEALVKDLRRLRDAALTAANRSVRIAGDIHNALIVTGDHNIIQYFAAPVRALPTDYADRVENFLHEYLGTPEHPVPFGGREAELRALSAWLEDEDAPPYLLLTAPAGKGKSALLVRWAAGLRAREDVAVVFVPVSIRFNTNLYGVTFAILAAQLARVYGKKPPEKDETPEMWRAFVTETLKEPPPDGKRVVVVVDGLDEAADWTPGADMFPYQPGERVRVVVSARLTATHYTPEDWLRTLNWDRPGRARAMELTGLSREGVADVLIQMGFPLDELGRNVDIVAELYRLTEGDPLLVRLYVDDLWARGEEAARLRPEGLRDIEPGYKGYFKRWWEDQRKLWGKEAPLKERAVQEVLDLLACALGPLTQEELLILANEETHLTPWTLEEALRPIERFVVGNREQGYVLAHPKLGEYFRGEVLGAREVRRIEGRFIAWGLDVLCQLEAGDLPVEDVPQYPLHYLSVHLAQANRWHELARLVESPAWYTASTYLDPSGHLFAADVERGLTWADSQVLEHANLGALPHVVAWSLLYATVRTRATKVPPAALEAMVLLGEIKRALRYATLTTDPRQQAEAFWRIGVTLLQQDDRSQACYALHQALSAAQDIPENEIHVGSVFSSRHEALIAVARALAQAGEEENTRKALDGALATAQNIGWGEYRARALSEVAEALIQVSKEERAHEILEIALAEAKKIEEERPRVSALCVVAEVLARAGEKSRARKALEQALTTAERIRAKEHRAHALATVAEVLAEVGEEEQACRVWEKALAMAEDIEEDGARASALSVVGEVLHQMGQEAQAREVVRWALAAAQRVGDEGCRTRVLPMVARALGRIGDKEHLDQVLTATLSIGDDWCCADVLSAIARALAQMGDRERLNQTLAAVKTIGNEWPRANALVEVIWALKQVGDRNTLRQAFGVAWDITTKEPRASVLATVAKASALVGEDEHAHQALQGVLIAIRDSRSGFPRARALAAMAESLAREGKNERARQALQEALAATENIEDERHRAETLVRVAQALTKVKDKEGLQRALAIAERTSSEWHRAQALFAVAEALAQMENRDALCQAYAIAQNIDIEKFRAHALAAVGQALVRVRDEERLHNVLTALQDIQGVSSRVRALAAVAQDLAQMGEKEQAYQVLQGSLPAIEGIQNEWHRAEALIQVARALAKVEDREGVEQVLAAAKRIKNTGYRVPILATVAEALAQMGEKERACQILQETLVTAQGIRIEKLRARALATVVRALSQVGDKEGLRRGLDAAQNIWNVEDRIWALAAVAQSLARVGEERQSRRVLHRALETAKYIKADVLVVMAQALVQVMHERDIEVAQWVVVAFHRARNRGRDEVWRLIEAFAPLLENLGVIEETWVRLQPVENVLT